MGRRIRSDDGSYLHRLPEGFSGSLDCDTTTTKTALKVPGSLDRPRLAAVLLARYARSCGPCFVGAGSSAPAPFIPTLSAGRANGSCRLDGPAVPDGWTGQGSRRLDGPGVPAAGRASGSATPEVSHTPPQPIRSFAPTGAYSLIPRTIWLAAADGPSRWSGRVGGTRASARHPHRLEKSTSTYPDRPFRPGPLARCQSTGPRLRLPSR